MKRVLLTGFEPFDGAAVNESWEAVSLLATDWEDPEIELVTARLPVTFADAPAQVLDLIAERGPFDAVINVGLDSSSKTVKLERVAVNLADARIPDNAGAQPRDEPLIAGGPAAYWSTLPTREAVDAGATKGLPLSLSYTAGTYVCNATFYRVMHAVPASTKAGFVHVPPASALSVAQSAEALETVIRTTLS